MAEDLNQDGLVDVLVSTGSGLYLFWNSVAGLSSNAATAVRLTSSDTDAAVVADFNNDGFLDIASSGDSILDVCMNLGSSSFAAATTIVNVGEAFGLATGDYNGDGPVYIIHPSISSRYMCVDWIVCVNPICSCALY